MRISGGLVAVLLIQACNPSPNQTALPASGVYTGLENMGLSHQDITPDDTTDRWYHENTLTIRADSVCLEQVPVVIKDRQKGYSASDGGFYSFRGKISQYPDSLVARFRLVDHDYVIMRYHIADSAANKASLSFEEKLKRGIVLLDSGAIRRSYPITILAQGLLMDGVTYRPKK